MACGCLGAARNDAIVYIFAVQGELFYHFFI